MEGLDRAIENHYAGNFHGSPNDREDEDVSELSNCCGALIKWGDICTECGEHCEPMGEEAV